MASDGKVNVFLTGGTGYIGGAALNLLLKVHKDLHITILVRDQKKADELKKSLGVSTVVASLEDSAILEEASSKSDVVLHFAHADHLGGAKAIIAGLKKRGARNGRKPLLIHTSGTGVLVEANKYPAGNYDDKFFTEAELGDIGGRDPKALHRDVDLEVLKAGESGEIDAVIVAPPMIYGVADAPVNQHSVQVPTLIKTALEKSHAVQTGKGENVWNNVFIGDLANFYILLFDTIWNAKDVTPYVNRNGYYFCENGENQIGDITKKIAQVLFDRGVITTKDVSALTPEENIVVAQYTGYNSRGKAEKARKLGWKPTGPAILDTVEAEVDYWISQQPKK